MKFLKIPILKYICEQLLPKWRRSVDGSGQAGALLTDLSKALDWTDYKLLIEKLYKYGFDKNSLFIYSYLKR